MQRLNLAHFFPASQVQLPPFSSLFEPRSTRMTPALAMSLDPPAIPDYTSTYNYICPAPPA